MRSVKPQKRKICPKTFVHRIVAMIEVEKGTEDRDRSVPLVGPDSSRISERVFREVLVLTKLVNLFRNLQLLPS